MSASDFHGGKLSLDTGAADADHMDNTECIVSVKCEISF